MDNRDHAPIKLEYESPPLTRIDPASQYSTAFAIGSCIGLGIGVLVMLLLHEEALRVLAYLGASPLILAHIKVTGHAGGLSSRAYVQSRFKRIRFWTAVVCGALYATTFTGFGRIAQMLDSGLMSDTLVAVPILFFFIVTPYVAVRLLVHFSVLPNHLPNQRDHQQDH